MDAKRRLTYLLNRTLILELEFEKWSAFTPATEALKNAKMMDRASEIITSLVVLAQACKGSSDEKGFEKQMNALLEMPENLSAQWARERADKLLDSFKGRHIV